MPSSTDNGETTALIYEDRAVSPETSTVRRKSFFVVLGTVCIGVGLCLAIALPITLSSSNGSSKEQTPVAFSGGKLQNQYDFRNHSTTTEADGNGIDGTASGDYSTTHHHFPTRNYSITHHHFPTRNYSTTHHHIPTRAPFRSCPYVFPGRRSRIDLELLNGKLLFELYRVQTDNSPANVYSIACSTMELDLNLSNGTERTNGTMKLRWAEDRFFSKDFHSLDVNLEGNSWPNTPFDFTETVGNNSMTKSQLSLLVQADGYLLTYECFPDVRAFPRPGYAIHLYSILPWRADEWLAETLMTLANIWGLNPNEERRIRVSRGLCDLD